MVCLPCPSHRATLERLRNTDCLVSISTEEPGTRLLFNIVTGNVIQVKKISHMTATRHVLEQFWQELSAPSLSKLKAE